MLSVSIFFFIIWQRNCLLQSTSTWTCESFAIIFICICVFASMFGRGADCLVGEYLSPLNLSEKKRECWDYAMWWRDISHQESCLLFQGFSQVKLTKTPWKKKQNEKNPSKRKYCLMNMGFGHLKVFNWQVFKAFLLCKALSPAFWR